MFAVRFKRGQHIVRIDCRKSFTWSLRLGSQGLSFRGSPTWHKISVS
jgi:hypothetical protein